MNDYGFELLSDQPIPVDDTNVYELFSPEDLLNDIQRSVNATEMAMPELTTDLLRERIGAAAAVRESRQD